MSLERVEGGTQVVRPPEDQEMVGRWAEGRPLAVRIEHVDSVFGKIFDSDQEEGNSSWQSSSLCLSVEGILWGRLPDHIGQEPSACTDLWLFWLIPPEQVLIPVASGVQTESVGIPVILTEEGQVSDPQGR